MRYLQKKGKYVLLLVCTIFSFVRINSLECHEICHCCPRLGNKVKTKTIINSTTNNPNISQIKETNKNENQKDKTGDKKSIKQGTGINLDNEKKSSEEEIIEQRIEEYIYSGEIGELVVKNKTLINNNGEIDQDLYNIINHDLLNKLTAYLDKNKNLFFIL